MLVPITALYGGLLMIIAIVLGAHVGNFRGKVGISILHGDNTELAERMRRHGNFIENVPLILVLLVINELNGASAMLLHGMGITLVLARIAHPIGLRADNIGHPLRFVGAAGTALVLVVAGISALWPVVRAF